MTIVSGINVGVDTYGLIRPGDQAPTPEIQHYVAALRDSNVGLPYSERDRQVKLALVQSSTADCVIVGSSHVMTFRGESNKAISAVCRALDNAGVSGASIEDTMTNLGAALDNPRVKHIFIGLDAWSFKRNARTKWRQLMPSFIAARRSFGLDLAAYDLQTGDTLDQQLAQAFSFMYLGRNWSALTSIVTRKHETEDVTPMTEGDLPQRMVLRSDGSLSYPEEFKPSPDEAAVTIGELWTKPPFIDDAVVAEVTQALRAVKSANKVVTIVVTPYHPLVRTCVAPDLCHCLDAVEPIIRGIGAKLGIQILGGFDPGRFGYTPDSFIDYQHLRSSELRRLTILPSPSL